MPKEFHVMRKCLNVGFVLAAFALPLGSARADFVAGFGGNTQPEIADGGGTTQGFINFAVFNTVNGTAGDHFGTGIAGIDAALAAAGFNTTSNFLYLFQDVNIGNDIASSSVNVRSTNVTGFGVLAGEGYVQVTGAAHPFLGSVAAGAGNISGAVTDATKANAGVNAQSGLISPTLLTLNAQSLVATFSPAIAGTGTRSPLWGYTSNLAPTFGLGSIQDGGIAANGTVPTAVPEPSALGLSLAGMLAAAGYALRRRRRLRLA
jgi:hypothetical protein